MLLHPFIYYQTLPKMYYGCLPNLVFWLFTLWAATISKIKHRTNAFHEPFDSSHNLTFLGSRRSPSEITHLIFLKTNTPTRFGITLSLEQPAMNNKDVLLPLENGLFQTGLIPKTSWSGNFNPKERSCHGHSSQGYPLWEMLVEGLCNNILSACIFFVDVT